ncbi:putative NAD dependent epimerase/dehydratase [Aspergillus steynii IBT 23096]|uniref:Putative NAD dependent epimerase/dehydratase n=1 Tax=Aspergillus steynii IBT 23096 TaxID=1392250 RepID=A0A2I2FTS0_9EURO|nr:putative NAD dependent epimerase/dehydratase [Aspergillus steynii IBT 23096]PLB43977.1 putative NAD dependent epimerase/dehydratase [Aspergillus steynii IBT 23096]
MTPKIFVCGATGTQGGATTHHLLQKGASVHALVRDPNSHGGQKLQEVGVTVTPGNYDDEDSLRKGLQGCAGLFLNLSPDFQNEKHEVEQARRILSIAKASGVSRIVYASAFAVNDPERLTAWDPNGFLGKIILSKQAIENEVRAAGFDSWTIIRPANFMSNYLSPLATMLYPGLVETGVWTTALLKETLVPMVDPNDIGRFAAEAILDPSRFHTKEIDLASELLTAEDILKELAQATGRQFKAHFLTEEEINAQAAVNPMIKGQLGMRDMYRFVNIEDVKAWGFPLGTFGGFLERKKESVGKTYSV